MRMIYTAIQHMYYPTPDETGEAVLENFKTQEGCLGGRFLKSGGGKPDRVQVFFESDIQITDWYNARPDIDDNTRYVLMFREMEKMLGIN
jgi:hypothetical protein